MKLSLSLLLLLGALIPANCLALAGIDIVEVVLEATTNLIMPVLDYYLDDIENDDDDEDLGPIFESSEEAAIYYGPVDRFWRNHADSKTLILDGVDFYPIIEDCLKEPLHLIQDSTENKSNYDNNTSTKTRKVAERFLDPQGDGPIVLVAIEDALSPEHALAVQALEVCARSHIPHVHEKRPMAQVYHQKPDGEEAQTMGGNNPTHLNVLINLFLPEVVASLYETLEVAFDAAGWQGLVARDEVMRTPRRFASGKPHQLGIRAVEYLTYDGFNNLMTHVDGLETNMVLTLVLSDPEEYEGGNFYIYSAPDNLHFIKPKKYSALAFKGGQYPHGLESFKGSREALCLEFWYYPDLPFGSNLCSAEAGNMEEYIQTCNPLQTTKKGVANYDIPCEEEFPSQSEYGVCRSQGGQQNIYEQAGKTQKQQWEAKKK